MCKLCLKKVPNANIINKNVFDCDFDIKFDYIYINAVIHNFPAEDVDKLVLLMYKWLKDDGIVLCTTTVNEIDCEGYEEKTDYNNKLKRFRHRYTKDSFDNIFLKSNFKIIKKKYKEEKDNTRSKLWQILYLKK